MHTTKCMLYMLYFGKNVYVSRFYLFHIYTKYMVNLKTFILEVTGSKLVTGTECLD
jgi:hypothetical protein